MLVLSLKCFDLDYNTFETVKLDSRCEFDQALNMKRYTLEGVEASEKANALMEMTDSGIDPSSELPDGDYEYKLAGVLFHHGVAQGGYYYSFIRDRSDRTFLKLRRGDMMALVNHGDLWSMICPILSIMI